MLLLQHFMSTRQLRFPYWTVFFIACSCSVPGWPAQTPAFEVASVKPVPLQSTGRLRSTIRGGPGTSDPEHLILTSVTLKTVILRAYDVKTYQVAGPDWLSSLRYDIAAKIPPGTTKEQFNLMLQNLLAERFHLSLHHETRNLQGYELLRGKTEPKLKPSSETGSDVQPTEAPKTDANGFPQLAAPGLVILEGSRGSVVISFLTARAQTLSAFAERLSSEFRMPVLDNTGLAGKFDFTLEFAPQPPGALLEASDESAANLISAIPRQLGLKLDPKKIPVDILVIDAADKIPTGN